VVLSVNELVFSRFRHFLATTRIVNAFGRAKRPFVVETGMRGTDFHFPTSLLDWKQRHFRRKLGMKVQDIRQWSKGVSETITEP
jgi:hypothetical protein